MQRERQPKTPRVTLLFFLFVAAVYGCIYPYIAWVNNPNENVRTFMTMALVEDHTLRVDRMVDRHGWTNDMALVPEVGTTNSHRYSVKGPAVSFAGIPFYWAYTKVAPLFGRPVPTVKSSPAMRADWLRNSTFVLRFFVVQLPCFVFLVWFERWLRRTSPDPVLRLSAVAAVGLGTNYLAYSLMFVSHALFAVTAFVSFALITDERARYPDDVRRRRLSRAFWAGLFAGLSTLLEYHAFPISVGLALYALASFWRPTRYLMFVAGASLSAALLMFFQWRAFGHPLTPGHKMVENQFFASRHHEGFFGMVMPSWEVFRDISVSRAYGFFGASPYMWLGLLAIPFALFITFGTRRGRRQRRLATAAWLGLMLILWLTVSAANNWRGGWTVGPRYLGAAPPFFAFGAVCALEALARRGAIVRAIARGLAGGLALISVAQTGLVSIQLNTLPEGVTRPLLQIAIPLFRVGFVPHHAGEWVGLTGVAFFYVVAAGFFAAPLIIALWPMRERWATYLTRLTVGVVAAAVALHAALSPPRPEEEDSGAGELRNLAHRWEPEGRDFIAVTRVQAERLGPRGPCLWYRLADLERIVHWDSEVTRDEKGERAS